MYQSTTAAKWASVITQSFKGSQFRNAPVGQPKRSPGHCPTSTLRMTKRHDGHPHPSTERSSNVFEPEIDGEKDRVKFIGFHPSSQLIHPSIQPPFIHPGSYKKGKKERTHLNSKPSWDSSSGSYKKGKKRTLCTGRHQ